MKDRELTIKKLSDMSGVPKSTISEWLSGRSPKVTPDLINLAKVLNISLDELLTGKSIEERVVDQLVNDKKEFIQLFKGVYRVTVEKEK